MLCLTGSIFLSHKKGHDMESLLFHFLDDWLFKFSADLFFVPRVCIQHLLSIDGLNYGGICSIEFNMKDTRTD